MSPYAKAILAALAAAVSFLYAASGDGLSTQDWLGAAVALLGAGGTVLAVPNKPRPPN